MPKVVSLGLQLLLNIGYLCDDLGGGVGGGGLVGIPFLPFLTLFAYEGGDWGLWTKESVSSKAGVGQGGWAD